MRITERYTPQEMTDFTIGWDADLFRLDSDYTAFIQTYLMLPLIDTRRGERDRPAATAERAGGFRVTQAHNRRGSQARWRAGWPELPTTVTCWGRTGETYQIPIAPAPVGHELVGVRGPTLASIEYTGQALELSASLMGMVQTSMDLLSIYGILISFQMPASSSTPAGVAAGPSAPPPAAERGGRGTLVRSQGRDRRTHTESSSRGPVPDDDDSDEDEELASPQSVSSQGGDDARDDSAEGSRDGSGADSGSDADGGADGDSSEAMPRKRAMMASRS